MNNTTVLIGNGLNLAEKMSVSWDTLLNHLTVTEDSSTVHKLNNTFKFEYIEYKAVRQNQFENSHKVKEAVSKEISERIPGGKNHSDFPWKKTLHSLFMNLPCNSYLTTNYDYALEYSLNRLFRPQSHTNERLYSLKRKQVVNGKDVYHVHGECNKIDSILLGYEHYAGTLEKIRNSIVKSTASKNSEDHRGHTFALNDYLIGLETMPKDWIYKFFTDDIYIVGFGLDFSELDIWWLLSYRKRAETEGKIQTHNDIYYLDTESNAKHSDAEFLAKMELLETYGVEVIRCEGKGYKARYKKAADFIKKQMLKNTEVC